MAGELHEAEPNMRTSYFADPQDSTKGKLVDDLTHREIQEIACNWKRNRSTAWSVPGLIILRLLNELEHVETDATQGRDA